MSSAQNKIPESSKTTSSPKNRTDVPASPHPETSSSSSPSEAIMDQHLESTVMVTPPAPPAPPTPPKPMSSAMSSPAPEQPTPPAPTSEEKAPATSLLRHQPIPPASEPMQYRAIGLVRGKYVASEEQFTRGELLTEDGAALDAVLLGRVMSLVKKHVNLEDSHLWVVYPRTREDEENLHVQIVGVWEPEKLSRVDDIVTEDSHDHDAEVLDESEDDESDEIDEVEAIDEVDEADEATETEEIDAVVEAVEANEATDTVTDTVVEEAEIPVKAPTAPKTEQPVAAHSDTTSSDLDDRYFSIRGEIVFQSIEQEKLLVKIRRAPQPGPKPSKAFKIALKGVLEGKAVGYFWDLNVERHGVDLMVRDGTMIGLVPPQKRKGGAGKGGPRRRGAGGPPRKPWKSREGGQQRPPRRSDGPPREGRSENFQSSGPRPPVSKPIKKRKED